MGLSPVLSGAQQVQSAFKQRLLAGLFAFLLTQSWGVAQAQISISRSAVEPAEKDTAGDTDPKKLQKYDIDHIGQRGIGSGFNLYSLAKEHELGRGLAAAIDRDTKLIDDPLVTDYVNRLAQKIVVHSDCEIPFTIKVIDSGSIPRAYGLPGGFLYVDSALILAADGEAELAAIMAHEIAHVAARHATRALSRQRVYHIATSIAFLAGPAGVALEDAGGVAGPLSVKKFLRDAEYEADLLALEYAYSSGYDPQALIDALEKLHALEAGRTPDLSKVPGHHLVSAIPFHSKIARSFANYPVTEERIQRLHSEIASFLPTRSDYILDTDEFQEVRARLLASRTPVLRHHAGDDENKGPVLRRPVDVTDATPTGSPDSPDLKRIARGFASSAPAK